MALHALCVHQALTKGIGMGKAAWYSEALLEERMKYRFASTHAHEKGTIGLGRKKLINGDKDNPSSGSAFGGKQNTCVIFPAKVNMVAEAIETRNTNWIVQTKVASDLVVQVGDSTFHLHKLPMVSRSGYLNRLAFKQRNNGGKDNSPTNTIRIDNLPGGTEIFELVVKFCYGWKIEITATNIASLYSAAHFLEMSDDLEPGNLVSKADTFLNYVLFSSWKDVFRILKSCEAISSWAKELQILKRCCEAIAWKASRDPKGFTLSDDEAPEKAEVENSINADNWWFEDVSSLRIDHFIEVIRSIKSKGMRSELVGSCIAHWTGKWRSQMHLGLENLTPRHLTQKLRRVTTESLIRILPDDANSVSCNFLLQLVQLGLMTKINLELLNKLETRTALMLEQCRVSDLLVENHTDDDTVHDVSVVIRVLETYVSCVLRINPAPKILVVGKLVDGYLTQVARDEKLSVKNFQSLAEALPRNARHCHEYLYRAMDIYLKTHPGLAEGDRASVCRAMEYHKLSREARHHALKNDRLPLDSRRQFFIMEQVNMTRPMMATGSNQQRTKTEAVIRVGESMEKGCMTYHNKEIKMMKKEVDMMKVQLSQLQMCKIKLQKQAQRCIV